MNNLYDDNKYLNLDDMKKIQKKLNDIILKSTYKYYAANFRKMIVEVFNNKRIRYINKNSDDYALLLDLENENKNNIEIFCKNSHDIIANVSIRKDFIKTLGIKDLCINLDFLYISDKVVNNKNIDKYFHALNMLDAYNNRHHLCNILYYYGWANDAWKEYHKKQIKYLKKNNILFYNLLCDKPLYDIDNNSIMDLSEYYNRCGHYIHRKGSSVAVYVSLFQEHIKKCIKNAKI